MCWKAEFDARNRRFSSCVYEFSSTLGGHSLGARGRYKTKGYWCLCFRKVQEMVGLHTYLVSHLCIQAYMRYELSIQMR